MPISPQLAAYRLCKAADWSVPQALVQKALYLAHMHFLGQNNGQPLVDEKFQAWVYGPVLPSLYRKLEVFGGRPVRDIWWRMDHNHSSPETDLVDEVGRQIKDIPPSRLVALTHHPDGAWAKHYEPKAGHRVIPNDDIQEEYRQLWHKKYASPAQA